MSKIIPFALNVPINLKGAKLNFNIGESLRSGVSDFKSLPHNHNDWELRYVANGHVTQYVDGNEYKLTAGDVIILQPKATHYQTKEPKVSHLTQYTLRLTVKNTEDPTARELQAILNDTFILRDKKNAMASLFSRLWNEITEKKPGYFNYIQSICLAILIEFLRLCSADTQKVLEIDDSKYSSYWYDAIDYYLHGNFMQPLKLEDLAEEIHLSPRHTSRIVLKLYGMSFVQKLTEIRLDNAKYNLKHTDHSLNTIAQECGFASYSYFTSCFRKRLGITPGEYRAKNRM